MRKRTWVLVIGVPFLIGLSFVPEPAPDPAPPPGASPFRWDRDETFHALEIRFDEASERGCEASDPELDAALERVDAALSELGDSLPANDRRWDQALEHLFEAAARSGACPARLPELARGLGELRRHLEDASVLWSLEDPAVRDRVYMLRHGRRAALEALLLQAPSAARSLVLERGVEERSEAPSITVHGVRLHSGDLLLSRGGAPTSALIARGNDRPGVFSHVALLHVADDGTPTVIEALIERGLVTGTVEAYLDDHKLRILVLRPRADLPAMEEDPLLAHRAAEAALARAHAEHVPYDFAMDHEDASRLFCSEVPYHPYRERGVALWRGMSTFSSRGLVRWLASLGVERFETLAPSDLELDPQLRTVAEWRDPDALFDAHIDDAILDVLLEEAEGGAALEPAILRLPFARAAKAYSVIASLFGGDGPVPEGMSATTALRVRALDARHQVVRARLEAAIERYERERGRRPPFWRLVELAREASRES